MADFAEIDKIFAAQKALVDQRRLTFGLTERRAALQALGDLVKAHENEIISALYEDFRKPEHEVKLTEILPVLQEIRHARRHLRRWMRPKRVTPSLALFGTSARILAQPRGTTLVLSPFNFPFNLSLGPVVSALAAGNSVILKPSELTPATSALIAGLVAQVFSPDLVAVIQGDFKVSEHLTSLPFDHIFFTGSPATGRKVMAAAAQNLTPVTLELGGKSPTILGPNADIDSAARWICFGKFTNAGQTCIAPDHIFVPESQHDALVAALKSEIARAYPPEKLANIVNDRHAARLKSLLEEALSAGAQSSVPAPADGRSIPPILLTETMPNLRINQEEIFGPLLPIHRYTALDQVIAQINSGPRPLALYVFDRDKSTVNQVLSATLSGSAGVNLTVAQFSHEGLPFGGVGNSGIGQAHGHHGFRSFSHERSILKNRFSFLPMIFPPFSGFKRRLVDLTLRIFG